MSLNFGPFLQKLSERKLIFVSGKGGVGKSLVAASVAHEQARLGRRTLLVEVGETSYFKDFWHLPAVGHDPVGLPGKVDLALWSGETCLKEYVLHLLKMERLYKIFFENRVMRALVNIAPGLAEVAILGKITSGLRKVGPPLDYDVVVIDMPATGHALSMLRAPKGLAEAIRIGPMGAHSREMDKILRDGDLCSYILVTLPEELPVVETLEFAATLKAEFGIQPSLVMNKVWRFPSLPEASQIAGQTSPATKTFLGHFQKTFDRQVSQIAAIKSALIEIPMLLEPEPHALVDRVGEALRQA